MTTPDHGTRARAAVMVAMSRRALISALGATAAPVAAALATGTGCGASGACSRFPPLTEGPYYLANPAERADITEGLEGAPFTMRIVVQGTDCAPIPGATVDVWHAAPDGTYSGVEDAEGETYLRGVQTTDGDGVATFRSVVPGWYPGRTTHVHFKVLLDGAEVLTSQAFFEEAALSAIYATGAYAARGDKDTANDDDGLFDDVDAEAATFAMEEGSDGSWTGSLTVDVAG
jgi:protocatechuate 3,4-dioxygenase beta subunit